MERIATVRLPAIFQWPETAEAGALLAYGPRYIETYRERARMVVKILRGAKPADIPVQQPTRFELVVNLKAAKAIGYEVPNAMDRGADKVIDVNDPKKTLTASELYQARNQSLATSTVLA